MDLRHLRYFAAVAEEENVTRAAARLHVSQPSLSRQIRDLEDELDVALFTRGAKTMRLTDAGKIFLTEARAVLQRMAEAVKAVRSVANGQSGELHVGYAPSLSVELLPPALKCFQEAYPEVRVQLHDLSSQAMLAGVRDGTLHVALMPKISEKVLAGLVFEELRRYPIGLAMHPTHPLTRLRKVGLAHLVDERLIAFTLADYPEYHEWLADSFAPLTTPRIVEQHDSATSLIAAVEAGRGVAIVPQRIDAFSGSRLKIRPLTPAPRPCVVGIVYRKETCSVVTDRFVAATSRAKSA